MKTASESVVTTQYTFDTCLAQVGKHTLGVHNHGNGSLTIDIIKPGGPETLINIADIKGVIQVDIATSRLTKNDLDMRAACCTDLPELTDAEIDKLIGEDIENMEGAAV